MIRSQIPSLHERRSMAEFWVGKMAYDVCQLHNRIFNLVPFPG